jgi:very-short-patch-repair endonuclease
MNLNHLTHLTMLMQCIMTKHGLALIRLYDRKIDQRLQNLLIDIQNVYFNILFCFYQ